MMTDLSVSDHGFRDCGRNGLTGAKLVNGHIMGFLELKTNYVAMTGVFFPNYNPFINPRRCLCHQSRSCRGLILPAGGQDSLGLVAPGQPVDPALDENQTELGVLVLSVSLQMPSDIHSLLNGIAEFLCLRILRILLPVTKRTWATPWESLRITPI